MVGHHLGQLVLRVGLAATFLVAGLSKVLPKDQYEGEAAAALANMGVITPQPAAVPTPGGSGEVTTEPTAYQPTTREQQDEVLARTNAELRRALEQLQADLNARKASAQPEEPAEQPDPPATAPGRASQPDESEVRSLTPQPEESVEAPVPATPATTSTPAAQYTAADFPNPVELPRVYRIALMLKGAAHPAPEEDGTARMALVPTWAADTKVPGLGMATPVVLAWLAAITEIVGGGMLLVGFMSRLWALGLVGVMLTAIWLTAIGPAMQAGTTYMGFLPDKGHIFAITNQGFAYMHEFWLLALLCMSAAVMFAGPGAISVDGILFGAGGGDEEGDD